MVAPSAHTWDEREDYESRKCGGNIKVSHLLDNVYARLYFSFCRDQDCGVNYLTVLRIERKFRLLCNGQIKTFCKAVSSVTCQDRIEKIPTLL